VRRGLKWVASDRRAVDRLKSVSFRIQMFGQWTMDNAARQVGGVAKPRAWPSDEDAAQVGDVRPTNDACFIG
jgi:hypothetical protein